MLISLCTHCQARHDLSDKLLSDTIFCQTCGKPFPVKENSRSIASKSQFADKLRPDKSVPSAGNTKHSLTLPPPPRELWTGKGEDESAGRFSEYRHNSRAVQEFLERHDVSDYSWLLAAGLLSTTIIVLAFMAFLIYLIVR